LGTDGQKLESTVPPHAGVPIAMLVFLGFDWDKLSNFLLQVFWTAATLFDRPFIRNASPGLLSVLFFNLPFSPIDLGLPQTLLPPLAFQEVSLDCDWFLGSVHGTLLPVGDPALPLRFCGPTTVIYPLPPNLVTFGAPGFHLLPVPRESHLVVFWF